MRFLLPVLIVLLVSGIVVVGVTKALEVYGRHKRLEDRHQLELEREREKDRRDLDEYLDERLKGDPS